MNARTATAATCGILAAALGVATAHLAALVSPPSSPVLAVGSTVIDRAPPPVKEWAVSTFGTADKPILIGSVTVVALFLAALVGLLRLRSRAAAVAVLVLLTVLAGAAAVLRPETGSFAWLPALVAAVVGVATLELLVARTGLLRQGHAVPGAVALGAGGQALARRRSPVTITLPAPAEPLPPLPKGVDLGKAGISPFVTPNADFYRIDTALFVPKVDPGDWSLTIDGRDALVAFGTERGWATDGTGPWQRATLGAEADIDCWRQWFLPWEATDGGHDLTVRATDGTGGVQTTDTANPYPLGATGLHSFAITVG